MQRFKETIIRQHYNNMNINNISQHIDSSKVIKIHVWFSPSFADVKQVSHHPQQQLAGAYSAVVICSHLVSDQILTLFSSQLLSFTKRVNVYIVVDVITPAKQLISQLTL